MINSIDCPLLTVIIPTHRRPHFLPRAVESALQAAADGNVEVIVVPNGGDQSWQSSLFNYLNNSRVIISPIETGNANAARNHGMKLAKGKYIRFLDDDDYLLETAKDQIELLEKTKSDVCSAIINTVDNYGTILDTLIQADTPCFFAGMITSKRINATTCHVFLREKIQNTKWDDSLGFSQDCDWIIRLAAENDLSWVKLSTVCGVWVKHTGTRISTLAPMHERKKIIAEVIIRNLNNQNIPGNVKEHIRYHAAKGLWDLAHQAFFTHPIYWSKIANYAHQMDSSVTPQNEIHAFNRRYLGISPVLVEWIVTPKRLLHYWCKYLLLKLNLKKSW